MNNSDSARLSENGQQKRQEMLVELQQSLVRRSHRKTHVRAASIATLAVAALAIPIVWINGIAERSATTKRVGTSGILKAAASRGSIEKAVVFTRDALTDRYVINNSDVALSIQFDVISDEHLLQLMAESGQTSSLGRIGGEMVVVSESAVRNGKTN